MNRSVPPSAFVPFSTRRSRRLPLLAALKPTRRRGRKPNQAIYPSVPSSARRCAVRRRPPSPSHRSPLFLARRDSCERARTSPSETFTSKPSHGHPPIWPSPRPPFPSNFSSFIRFEINFLFFRSKPSLFWSMSLILNPGGEDTCYTPLVTAAATTARQGGGGRGGLVAARSSATACCHRSWFFLRRFALPFPSRM